MTTNAQLEALNDRQREVVHYVASNEGITEAKALEILTASGQILWYR